jgi:hypothetical protein
MIFLVRIRLKGTKRYVGKRKPSYAFTCDRVAATMPDHWHDRRRRTSTLFVHEKHAHVWTSPAALKTLLSYSVDERGKKWSDETWSDYEAVKVDGTVLPLDDLMRELP